MDKTFEEKLKELIVSYRTGEFEGIDSYLLAEYIHDCLLTYKDVEERRKNISRYKSL
jgi:hypothetical protein